MSISETPAAVTDFDDWLRESFAEGGAFTMLVILLKDEEQTVVPLCSTYLHVIGDEVDWSEMSLMLTGSGMPWDSVVIFAVRRSGAALSNVDAQSRLREMEKAVIEDRMKINEGHFFDSLGRRMKIEPATTH